ncbi:unnamed protein product [Chrysoparadoxa australica]
MQAKAPCGLSEFWSCLDGKARDSLLTMASDSLLSEVECSTCNDLLSCAIATLEEETKVKTGATTAGTLNQGPKKKGGLLKGKSAAPASDSTSAAPPAPAVALLKRVNGEFVREIVGVGTSAAQPPGDPSGPGHGSRKQGSEGDTKGSGAAEASAFVRYSGGVFNLLRSSSLDDGIGELAGELQQLDGGGEGEEAIQLARAATALPCAYCSGKLALRFVDMLTYPRPVHKFHLLLDRDLLVGSIREMMAAEKDMPAHEVVLMTRGKPIPTSLDDHRLEDICKKRNQLIAISKVLGGDTLFEGDSGAKNKQFVGDLLFGSAASAVDHPMPSRAGARSNAAGLVLGGAMNAKTDKDLSGAGTMVTIFRVNHGLQILGITLESLARKGLVTAWSAEMGARRHEAQLLDSLEKELTEAGEDKVSSKKAKNKRKKEKERKRKEEAAKKARDEEEAKAKLREEKIRERQEKEEAGRKLKAELEKRQKEEAIRQWKAEQIQLQKAEDQLAKERKVEAERALKEKKEKELRDLEAKKKAEEAAARRAEEERQAESRRQQQQAAKKQAKLQQQQQQQQQKQRRAATGTFSQRSQVKQQVNSHAARPQAQVNSKGQQFHPGLGMQRVPAKPTAPPPQAAAKQKPPAPLSHATGASPPGLPGTAASTAAAGSGATAVPLPVPKFCSNCGHQLSTAGAKFCAFCGNQVTPAVTGAAAVDTAVDLTPPPAAAAAHNHPVGTVPAALEIPQRTGFAYSNSSPLSSLSSLHQGLPLSNAMPSPGSGHGPAPTSYRASLNGPSSSDGSTSSVSAPHAAPGFPSSSGMNVLGSSYDTYGSVAGAGTGAGAAAPGAASHPQGLHAHPSHTHSQGLPAHSHGLGIIGRNSMQQQGLVGLIGGVPVSQGRGTSPSSIPAHPNSHMQLPGHHVSGIIGPGAGAGGAASLNAAAAAGSIRQAGVGVIGGSQGTPSLPPGLLSSSLLGGAGGPQQQGAEGQDSSLPLFQRLREGP